MKTITEVRNAFWDVHTEFKSEGDWFGVSLGQNLNASLQKT